MMPGSRLVARRPPRGAAAWHATATVLRIDARRPASWLAAAAAAGCVPLVGRPEEGVRLAGAIACGALAGAAACGEPPVVAVAGRHDPAWWLLRCWWPVAGWFLSASLSNADRGSLVVPVATTATGIAAWWSARHGATPADALSQALVAAGAAAVTAWIAAALGPAPAGALAGLVWLAVAAVGGIQAPGARATAGWQPGLGAGSRLPFSTVALGTTLAGMVVCYFLDPEWSWCQAVLVSAWFVCLAVPRETLGAGTADVERRRWLHADGDLFRRRGSSAAATALILGWPALVAAAIQGRGATRLGGPLTAVLALAGLVVVCLLAGAVCGGKRRSETHLAIAMALIAAVVAVATRLQPDHPILPSLVGRQAAASPRIAVPIAVERFRRSCETSQPPQPTAAARVGLVVAEHPAFESRTSRGFHDE